MEQDISLEATSTTLEGSKEEGLRSETDDHSSDIELGGGGNTAAPSSDKVQFEDEPEQPKEIELPEEMKSSPVYGKIMEMVEAGKLTKEVSDELLLSYSGIYGKAVEEFDKEISKIQELASQKTLKDLENKESEDFINWTATLGSPENLENIKAYASHKLSYANASKELSEKLLNNKDYLEFIRLERDRSSREVKPMIKATEQEEGLQKARKRLTELGIHLRY